MAYLARQGGIGASKPNWDGIDWDLVGSTYQIWRGMHARCRNKKQYPGYAARGITVSDEWAKFSTFIRDVGIRPTYEHSIDRKDVNGNYDKNNCYWATPTEQVRNRRNTIFVEIEGKRIALAEVCDVAGVSLTLVYRRVFVFNWPLHLALETKSRALKHMPKYGRRHDGRSVVVLGVSFGRLTVVDESDRDSIGNCMVVCQCDCGNRIVARFSKLKRGSPNSCGRCNPRLGNPPLLFCEAAE